MLDLTAVAAGKGSHSKLTQHHVPSGRRKLEPAQLGERVEVGGQPGAVHGPHLHKAEKVSIRRTESAVLIGIVVANFLFCSPNVPAEQS